MKGGGGGGRREAYASLLVSQACGGSCLGGNGKWWISCRLAFWSIILGPDMCVRMTAVNRRSADAVLGRERERMKGVLGW